MLDYMLIYIITNKIDEILERKAQFSNPIISFNHNHAF